MIDEMCKNICIEKYIKLTKILIAKGADLNVRDDLNRTPVMIAATFGHSEVLVNFFS